METVGKEKTGTTMCLQLVVLVLSFPNKSRLKDVCAQANQDQWYQQPTNFTFLLLSEIHVSFWFHTRSVITETNECNFIVIHFLDFLGVVFYFTILPMIAHGVFIVVGVCCAPMLLFDVVNHACFVNFFHRVDCAVWSGNSELVF